MQPQSCAARPERLPPAAGRGGSTNPSGRRPAGRESRETDSDLGQSSRIFPGVGPLGRGPEDGSGPARSRSLSLASGAAAAARGM